MTELRFAFLALATACGSVGSEVDAPSAPPDGDPPSVPDARIGVPDPDAMPPPPPDASPPDASPPDAMPVPVCGDGEVNQPEELCDLGPANADHRRCGSNCTWGAGLDGTVVGMWEPLTGGPNAWALQELHYSGMPFIHDFYSNQRYSITGDMWSVNVPTPTGNTIWSNAATAPDALFIAREGNLYRYDLALETWTPIAMGLPNGSIPLSAHAFDGDGNIWYHGPGNDLVRVNPMDGTFMSFTHPPHENFETRVVYDPVSNMILAGGFLATSFVRFDLNTMTFLPPSAPSPGGVFRDHTCGDRSGHVYTGADNSSALWVYTPSTDTWAAFPLPTPIPHDNNATCVVSQDGYYYFAAGTSWYRISLGVF